MARLGDDNRRKLLSCLDKAKAPAMKPGLFEQDRKPSNPRPFSLGLR